MGRRERKRARSLQSGAISATGGFDAGEHHRDAVRALGSRAQAILERDDMCRPFAFAVGPRGRN